MLKFEIMRKFLLHFVEQCDIITKLSREGSTEKAKQGFGPGGSKKVLKKVLTRAKQCDIIKTCCGNSKRTLKIEQHLAYKISP